jgi:hypothetical protein
VGAPGVDRKVISGLCCVDRMKASVVRPDGVGDGALGDPRDKRRGPCYSALGALQEVVISHDIFSADHHAEVARSRAGISAFSPCPVKSQFGYTGGRALSQDSAISLCSAATADSPLPHTVHRLSALSPCLACMESMLLWACNFPADAARRGPYTHTRARAMVNAIAMCEVKEVTGGSASHRVFSWRKFLGKCF